MRTIVLFIISLLIVLSWPEHANANSLNIAGTWVTEGGAHIDIQDCGDGTPCGALVWYESETGMSELDTENPDPALRDNPLRGTQIVWGFKAKGEKWKSGRIYDAENGKVYKSKLALKDDGTLKVSGCIGPICQGQIWTRLGENIP